jgi:hypothetical protein
MSKEKNDLTQRDTPGVRRTQQPKTLLLGRYYLAAITWPLLLGRYYLAAIT